MLHTKGSLAELSQTEGYRLTVSTPNGTPEILVVDDDESVITWLQSLLSSAGYRVAAAKDGASALAMISEHPPDLIVLDLDMPQIGGLEVCRRLKTDPKTRLIPIIVLTGQGEDGTRLSAWDLGADEFLAKPPRSDDIVSRCRSLLRLKRLTDELESAHAVLFALARAVEAKSPYTHGHSERVARLAIELATRVGLRDTEIEILRRGALLHDIGKIGIPDAILNKPSPLTEEEYGLVKQHPVQGVRIVEPLHSLHNVLPLIRSHHERLDGHGYPDGLFGDAIPLSVRILSVADVYDAVSSERPYRPGLEQGKALELLRIDAAGGGLDLELVSLFSQVMATGVHDLALEMTTA